MADEIKTRVTVDAAQGIKNLNDVTEAENRMAKATEQVKKQAEDARGPSDGLGRSLGFVKGEVLSLIGAMTGGFGLVKVWQDYEASIRAANEALKENAKLTRAAAEGRLDFVALKGFESAKDLKLIGDAAGLSGRDPGEVARTMTIVAGALGPENTKDIEAVTMQIAAKAQQTTTRMDQLAAPFIQLQKQTGDARVASNILEGAIDAAEEPDPGKVGEQVAKMVGMRSISGMGVGEAAGYAAASTGLGIDSNVAATSLQSLILGIRGQGGVAGPGSEILAREGIDLTNADTAIWQITQAAREGRITEQELELIGGREGLNILAPLVNKKTEDQFRSRVEAVKAAERADGSILSRKAKRIFEAGGFQANHLQTKQNEAATAHVKGTDLRAVETKNAKSVVELILAKAVKEGSISAADANAKLEDFDHLVAQGGTGLYAAEAVEEGKTFLTGLSNPGRYGPELGAAVYEAQQLGPNLDPNTARDFQLYPASGEDGAAWDALKGNARREALSSAPTIITNYHIGVMNGKPAAETPAKRKEQE